MKHKLAFLILRLSLGFVFLLFGIGKFKGDIWAQTIMTMEFFQALPWDVMVSVYLIGLIEIVTGIFLIIGLFTRFSAAAAALELMSILILLHFQEIRDIGLLAAALYMAVVEQRSFGIDALLERKHYLRS